MEKEKQPRHFSRKDLVTIGAAAGVTAGGVIGAVEIGAQLIHPTINPETNVAQAQGINPNADVEIGKTTVKGSVINSVFNQIDKLQGKSAKVVSPLNKELTVQAETINIEGVKISGLPTSGVTNVDVAKGRFANTLGIGTAWTAEPGALIVDADFESQFTSQNPNGANPGGWKTKWDSDGNIQILSDVNQHVARTPEFTQMVPGGGYLFVSTGGGGMTVDIGGTKIVELQAQRGVNYFLIVKGRNTDGQQDTDENLDLHFSGYKPDHIESEMYQSGDHARAAFISEGQFKQKARTSHSGGTNCGAEGCSKLVVVFIDANTLAAEIDVQTQGRFQDAGQGWRTVFKNGNW